MLILKTNASMIHRVINIQFGFVDLLVCLFRERAVQPCWHAQPHNFCLFTAVVDRPTCVLELHAPSKYAVKVNYFKKLIFFHEYVLFRSTFWLFQIFYEGDI